MRPPTYPRWLSCETRGALALRVLVACMLGFGALAALRWPALGAVLLGFTSAALLLGSLPRQAPEEKNPAFDLARLEFLSAYSNDAALLLGPGGEILEANPTALRFYGWTGEELKARRIRDLMHPDQTRWLEERWSEDRDRKGSLFESVHLRKDGSAFPVEVSSRCFEIEGRELRQLFVRDITARKQDEQRLQETLEQFRMLVDSVNGILWESDPSSLCATFVSRRAETLLGYSVEQWLTEKGFWRDHLHPEDRQATLAYFDMAEQELHPFSCEYRMLATDGRVVWIRDVVGITVKDGRPHKLHGVMLDITEHKELEAGLERARDYYFNVLDKLPSPVWQTTPGGHPTYVNQAWLDFTGEDAEEALRRPWFERVPSEEREACRRSFLEALESRGTFSLEHRFLHRDGTCHEVQNQGRPLVFQDQLLGYVGSLHDLRDLRAAERDLLRVKDLYHALIQTDHLIVHAGDRQALFEGLCRIATREGRFALAWVGLADRETHRVHIAASAGPAEHFPDGLHVAWEEDPSVKQNPTAACIRSGEHQVANDFLQEGGMGPWGGLAGEYGVQAAAAFPLREGGRVVGALTLYSQQAGFFDPDRVELLDEMAQDISFALDRFQAEERRREVEEALRESEDSLAKAQAIAQVGSWVWDVAKNQGRWSAGMELIYGFAFQEGPGHLQRVMEAVHPEDRVRYQSRLQQLIAQGGTMDCDYRILRPDGEERIFSAHAVAEAGADGGTTLVRGITQDVTERKRSEERARETLRELEDLKAAVDESAVVLVTDAEGTITYVNQRMCEITSYAPEEVLGRTPRLFSSNYHPRAFWEEMWEIVSAGGIWRGEVKNRSKDGTHHWLDTTIVPFLDEGGNPTRYMAIRFDITARKEAEEKVLAISADRMALLEAASVAKVVPWSMDLATGHLRMGDMALLVLGRPALAFHAHPTALRELLKSEDQKLLLHAQAEARAGLLGSFEAPIRRGERQTIWTRWTIARREGHLHGVIQDITEQHELHAQLLQSQKLESLGTLVSGITHDFNNILMGILGYAEVLSSMPELPAPALKGIGVIGRAAERGRGLVDQLLRFSRRTVATKVMHNLNDIVGEVQTLMQLPGDDRIQVERHLDAELPETLMDPGQVVQVAMNLAVNARDAIVGQGFLRFRTGRLELPDKEAAELDKRPGPYLFLEVEDTGSGIRPELQARIFEPFFTTKGTGKGTGLGLSVAHGIVEAHQGLIQCRSELGRGTCFRVLLPHVRQEALSEQLEHGAGQTTHRILLLDEAGHSRATAADLLIYMGNQVVAAHDPEKALEAHRSTPFELVILNLGMPGGAELLQRIQEALAGVPILGGTSAEEQSAPDLKHPPHALVHWPFRAVELLAAIQRLLG